MNICLLHSDEDGNLAVGVSPIVAIFAPINLSIGDYEKALGKATFDLDSADLEAGQRFTTGEFDMRMFAGLRYARLDHTLQTLANSDVTYLVRLFLCQ